MSTVWRLILQLIHSYFKTLQSGCETSVVITHSLVNYLQ